MPELTILITGVGLQGNKGAPALALSIMNQLTSKLSRKDLVLKYKFIVPIYSLKEEMKWANTYGVEVAPVFDIRWILPPTSITQLKMMPGNLKSLFTSLFKGHFYRFLKAFITADVVIDSSGITFVGPPIRHWSVALHNYQYSALCSLLKKPFFRWTQSYGPFTGNIVPYLAKKELGKAPFIMARGKSALANLEDLQTSCKLYDFPDVALTLPAETKIWAENHITNVLGIPKNKKLFGISPSAVLRNYQKSNSYSHELFCSKLIESLNHPDWAFILIPHTIRPNGPYSSCDLDVSKNIFALLPENIRKSTFIINDDLEVREFKAIIGKMDFFIGSRYHSLVAALSMKVPCLALSWHDKYQDLFEYFDLTEIVVNVIDDKPYSELIGSIKNYFNNRSEIQRKIEENLPEVLDKIEVGGNLIVNEVEKIAKK